MGKGLDVSVLIPVYNSERTIGPLVERLIDIYSGRYRLDIVLVNDGSTDDSARVCGRLADEHPEVTFIDLSKNFTQHNAIMAGMRYATGEVVVIMDDDLQHLPEDVEKLVDKLVEGHDVVYAQYDEKMHSVFRNLGSKANNLMAWALIGKPSWFDFTSFKAMRRYVADQIVRYDAPFPYIDGLILRVTDNIAVAPVTHTGRRYGGSTYTLRKLVGLWLNGFFNFSLLPLRICVWGGFFLAFAGFVFAGIQIVQKMLDPSITIGWTSIITLLLAFSGMQLIALGVIGEYVGRIFLTQNMTPAYVIKDVKGRGRHANGPFK